MKSLIEKFQKPHKNMRNCFWAAFVFLILSIFSLNFSYADIINSNTCIKEIFCFFSTVIRAFKNSFSPVVTAIIPVFLSGVVLLVSGKKGLSLFKFIPYLNGDG